jgi:hypothetical protein
MIYRPWFLIFTFYSILSIIPHFYQCHATDDFIENLRAPMPGRILRINVADKDYVQRGDILLIIEAMKMELSIRAPRPGYVRLRAEAGADVGYEENLLRIVQNPERVDGIGFNNDDNDDNDTPAPPFDKRIADNKIGAISPFIPNTLQIFNTAASNVLSNAFDGSMLLQLWSLSEGYNEVFVTKHKGHHEVRFQHGMFAYTSEGFQQISIGKTATVESWDEVKKAKSLPTNNIALKKIRSVKNPINSPLWEPFNNGSYHRQLCLIFLEVLFVFLLAPLLERIRQEISLIPRKLKRLLPKLI